MSDKEFFTYNPAEAVQPEYCESHFIFKSLYPDLDLEDELKFIQKHAAVENRWEFRLGA